MFPTNWNAIRLGYQNISDKTTKLKVLGDKREVSHFIIIRKENWGPN